VTLLECLLDNGDAAIAAAQRGTQRTATSAK
jgi:hypothetical protein